MNKSRPRHARASRSGRAVSLSIACLLAVCVLVAAVLYFTRAPAAERACREGDRLLQAGRNKLAAEQFSRAVTLDPHIGRAWHGWLRAEPTLAVCRRFADARAELFDLCQPVQDDAVLAREPGWIAERWRRTLDLYGRIVAGEPAAAGDANAAILRLDFMGRKEVTEAWDELRTLREELRTALKGALPPASLRPYAVYDLAGAQETVAGAIARFRTPKLWLDHFTRLEGAIQKQESGLARLNQVVKLDPSFLPAQLTLAYVDLARGRPKAAEQRCRTLLEARTARPGSPAEPRIRYCLSRALELSGNVEEAAAEVEGILRMRPENREARLRLSSLYLRLGRMDEAGLLAKSILQVYSGDPQASHIRGVVSLHQGDHEWAMVRLENALRAQPDNLDIRFSLARARRAAGRYASAFGEFTAVAKRRDELAVRPGWAFAAGSAAALAAGHGLDAAGAADKALADEATMTAYPEVRSHLFRFKFAGTAMQGGKHLATLPAPTLAELGPNRDLANYLVAGVVGGRAYAAADVRVAPDERLLAFFRSQPEDPSAQYCLAFLLAAGGQERLAREALEKLNRAHPKHHLGALHLARLHLIAGKTELAARTLRQIKPAEQSPEAARELALVESLQGASALNRSHDAPAASGASRLVGPHLAFFSVAIHADHQALARRIVLLDPTCDAARDILRLTYPYVREHGLEGVVMAAKADATVDQAIYRALALYRAEGGKLYRLAIGSFWDDLPAQL